MDSNLKFKKGLLLLCDSGDMPIDRLNVIIYNKLKSEWGINPMRLRKEIQGSLNFEKYLQEKLKENLYDLIVVCNIVIVEDETMHRIDLYKKGGNHFRLINI